MSNTIQPYRQIGVVLTNGEDIIIQESRYIEHGNYIEIINDTIILYEIPYGGGDPIMIGEFDTLQSAFDKANTLT